MLRIRHTLLFATFGLLFLGGLSACAEAPQERYKQAVAAAGTKDLAVYQTFFTARSAELLRGMKTASDRTRYNYLKNPYTLLPDRDPEETFVKDNYALLTFKERGKEITVTMLRENDNWVVDLFALDAFWSPLMGGE